MNFYVTEVAPAEIKILYFCLYEKISKGGNFGCKPETLQTSTSDMAPNENRNSRNIAQVS